MALESTILELVSSGGLAEDVNPRVLQPGSWLALENVAIDKGGAFKKRSGYYTPGAYDDTPYCQWPGLSTASLVGSIGNSLYQFRANTYPVDGDLNAQTDSPALMTLSAVTDEWQVRDDVSPLGIARRPGLRSHREVSGGAVLVAGGSVVYTVACLFAEDPTLPSSQPIVLRGVDIDGTVVQDDVVIGYLAPILTYLYGYTMKCAVISGYIVVVHPAGGGIKVTVYDPSTGTFGSTLAVTSVTAGFTFPSIWQSVRGNLIIAHGDDHTLYVREWEITGVASGTMVNVWSYLDTGAIFEVEVCTDNNENTNQGTKVFVTWGVLVSGGDAPVGATRSISLYQSTWDVDWGPVDLDPSQAWRTITNVWAGGYLVSTGMDQPTGAVDDALIFISQFSSDGSFASDRLLTGGLGLAARAFVIDSRPYLPVIVRGTGDGGPPYTGAIVCLATRGGFLAGEPAPLVGTFAVEEWGTFKFGGYFTPSKPALAPNGIVFAAPVFTGTQSTGLDVVRVTWTGAYSEDWKFPTTQAQGLLVVPGALTSYFDGQSVFEAGFLEPPFLVGHYVNATDGGIPALEEGEYIYVAHWEYFDALGNVHYSQPSTPYLVATGESGADSVDIDFATDRIGRRDRNIDGEQRKVRLIVYRTKKDSAGPFYRLTSPTIEKPLSNTVYNANVINDRYRTQIPFSDTTSDGQIDSRAYGLLPFDLSGNAAGVLDCDPPPPSIHALNHKQRLWLVSADNPRAVWYSREFRQNEAPCFSRGLQFEVSDADEGITALAPLGDKVLIFTKTRIYYVAGDGPGNTGQDGLPFQGPFLVSDSVGCADARSVVRFERGVCFASETRRESSDARTHLYAIGLDAQVKRISGPVEDTLKRFPVVVGAWSDPSRGWVGFGLRYAVFEGEDDFAMHVVWSYWTDQWTTWKTPGWRLTSTAIANGLHLWGGTYSYLQRGWFFAETPRAYEDPLTLAESPEPDSTQWITMRVQTPWLHPGALAGYARTRRVQVFGETPDGSECVLSMVLEHEHKDGAVSEYPFPISGDALSGYPLVRVEGIPAVQKCSAIRVTIQDAPKTEDARGPGVTLSAISLEIAGKRGLAKLSKFNRGRDAL